MTEYMWCGGLRSPLTSGNGIYFDGTPCFDVKTDGTPISAQLSFSAVMPIYLTFLYESCPKTGNITTSRPTFG